MPNEIAAQKSAKRKPSGMCEIHGALDDEQRGTTRDHTWMTGTFLDTSDPATFAQIVGRPVARKP